MRGQLRRDHPILNLRLFANRDFSVAVGCALLAMFGLVGIEFFGAQYLQMVLGLEPFAAALRQPEPAVDPDEPRSRSGSRPGV